MMVPVISPLLLLLGDNICGKIIHISPDLNNCPDETIPAADKGYSGETIAI